MDEVSIRPATIADVPTLLLFEQGVITAERSFDSTLKPDNIRYYDVEHMLSATHIQLLVAEVNNELAGCGYARLETAKHYLRHAQHAYLGFMYVVPAYRGKGINKEIINELLKWSASNKVHEIRLDVYHENTAAIKAYEKAGFVKHMIEMRVGL